MTSRLAIALLLLCSSVAWADTIRGEVSVVREARPGPDADVQVVQVETAAGETYRITDPDVVELLGWLQREQVVLEGGVVEGAFRVDRIVEPAFVPRLTGVLSTDEPGLSGRRRIRVADGTEAEVSGPNFLTLYTLSKDLRARELTFSAFELRDAAGALRELVVMEIEAQATAPLVFTEPAGFTLLKIVMPPLLFVDPPRVEGRVPAGAPVWILRRSLLGHSVKVRDAQNVAGFARWDDLQIGRVVEDGAPVTARATESKRGAVDALGSLGR